MALLVGMCVLVLAACELGDESGAATRVRAARAAGQQGHPDRRVAGAGRGPSWKQTAAAVPATGESAGERSRRRGRLDLRRPQRRPRLGLLGLRRGATSGSTWTCAERSLPLSSATARRWRLFSVASVRARLRTMQAGDLDLMSMTTSRGPRTRDYAVGQLHRRSRSTMARVS